MKKERKKRGKSKRWVHQEHIVGSPEYRWAAYLRLRYKMTEDDYLALFIQHEGKCAICKTHQDDLSKRLCIDHDHETGKIRGLLCHNCNTGIGNLRDSIALLTEATKYLIKHKE